MSLSRTAPAKSARNCSGYFLDADCAGDGQLPEMSVAIDKCFILSACISVADIAFRFLADLVFAAGASSSWLINIGAGSGVISFKG